MPILNKEVRKYNQEGYICPVCGSIGNFIACGKEEYSQKILQRITCKKCNKKTYTHKLLPPKDSKLEITLDEDKGDNFEENDFKNKIEIDKDNEHSKLVVNCRHLDIRTIEEAIKKAGIDLEKWEISREKISYNEVTMRLRKYKKIREIIDENKVKFIYQRISDVPLTVTNTNIAIELKPKLKFFEPEKFKEDIYKDLKDSSINIGKYKYPNVKQKEKHLFFYSLNDLHLARRSWKEETGIDYDMKIAQENYINSESHILSYVLPFPIDRICFVVGNDLFNYDYSSPYPHTEKMTPQETDTRWQKMFRIGRKLVIDAALRLSDLAPVDIIVVPGNHDHETVFYLGEILELFFRNNKNVNVDNRPTRRKYYRYDKNLLGFSHGNKERPKDLHAIMAGESDSYLEESAWSKTDFRYFYMGHKHHEEVHRHRVVEEVKSIKGIKLLHEVASEDYKGVLVDYLPNLAFRHDYEVDYGYIGTIRSAKAALHHIELGRVINFNYNISENKIRLKQRNKGKYERKEEKT